MTYRRTLWNLVLAGLVVLLAGLLWLDRQTADTARPSVQPTGVRSAPGRSIHTMDVRRGSDHVRAVHRADGWYLTEPVTARADGPHIRLLRALAHARPRHRIEGPALPASTTGLDDSAVVVRYDGGPPVRIGGPGPEAGTRYVETARGLMLVDVPHFQNLDWHWTDWLTRALVPAGQRIQRLVLPDYTLTRRADGPGWQASPQRHRPADAAGETVAAWQSVKALMIVPADPSRAPIGRIRLDFVDAPSRRLAVIENGPNLILRDPRLGVDYHLAGNRIGPLLTLRHPSLGDTRNASGMSK